MQYVSEVVVLILGLALICKGYLNSDNKKLRNKRYVMGAILILFIMPMLNSFYVAHWFTLVNEDIFIYLGSLVIEYRYEFQQTNVHF